MPDTFGLDSAIVALIGGLGKEAREWIDWWRKNRQEQQPLAILKEMLRYPKHRFRETGTLARAIHDTTPDYAVTTAFLRSLGARHNVKKGKDTWTFDDNWIEDPPGTWKLAPGVVPGRI